MGFKTNFLQDVVHLDCLNPTFKNMQSTDFKTYIKFKCQNVRIFKWKVTQPHTPLHWKSQKTLIYINVLRCSINIMYHPECTSWSAVISLSSRITFPSHFSLTLIHYSSVANRIYLFLNPFKIHVVVSSLKTKPIHRINQTG